MINPDIRKLLQWSGYLAAALVVALGSAIVILRSADEVRRFRLEADERRMTRTYEGPLTVHSEYDADIVRMLDLLPLRRMFAKGGLRFVAMPGLGWHHYAISLRDTGKEIEGTLITAEPNDSNHNRPDNIQAARFTMARGAYENLLGHVDKLARGYAGDSKICLDGVGIGFEHIAQRATISGAGNDCIDHYRVIADTVRISIRQFVNLPYGMGHGWFSNPSSVENQTGAKK